ncbi:Osteoclast-stimulating factor 1 [Polyrhizophydium stewartii]|uniref:Osteoclast-stimulating factor 1 n=1 Tax=Polyrhizophydium stewartii TaxID=2732419 RepID=A0ABR4MX84_9FUNG
MSAPPPPSRPGKKDVQVVRALYSYTPQRPDELAFEEGDVLFVLSKDDANWWKCRSGDKEGFVPSNYEAAKRGNASFVAELLAAGVSVNGLDKAGNAPIHWACRGGHVQVVELLLAKGPALNVQNKLGDTPLHLAAWGGSAAVVRLLLAQPGIRTDLRNNDGATPVQVAKTDDAAAALLNFAGSSAADNLAGGDDEDDD